MKEYTPKIITDLYNDTPTYRNNPYIAINNNIPIFSSNELKPECCEKYSERDKLNRCGAAFAVVGKESMTTEDRGDISNIRPTGWHSVKYDIISNKFLYNRCHLIGRQLASNTDHANNLITGTKFMNNQGMLPFENMIADYIKESNNHVAYRVTPIFLNNNLLASGVQMEAYSIGDDGKSICFNIYCFNVQPDIAINYEDGESRLITDDTPLFSSSPDSDYILDSKNMIYHKKSCSLVNKIKSEHKREYVGDKSSLIKLKYNECDKCKP